MGTALRAWQEAALRGFLSSRRTDFLTVATPGAGKTTFALSAAARMLTEGSVERVVVVVPTEHLKRQWADAAARFGVRLDPTWGSGSQLAPQYHGIVVTYAQVASDPGRHQRAMARPTLVVLDEVHHAGDSLSWGSAVREAFTGATRRLLLSGSPWRSDVNPIPFVEYVPDAHGVLRSRADHTYGYGDALRDAVVRPVVFLAYSGSARWRDRGGHEVETALDAALTRELSARALRTALDPSSEWVDSVLAAADARLTEVRRTIPDAGGLVLASNATHARAYARKLSALGVEDVAVVLSEDVGASAAIERFASSGARWMVAVRMVSEGVDVPRLAVGVYATNALTSMFFTQAVGRFVRARHAGESATVFLPAVPALLALGAEVEVQRDHALVRRDEDGDELLERANRTESTADVTGVRFEALEASARFERVIVNGAEFGAAADEVDEVETGALLLSASAGGVERVGELLRALGDEVPMHRRVHEARQRLAREVSSWSAASGVGHGALHAQLRGACGGPVVASCTLEQLEDRIREVGRMARPVPVWGPSAGISTRGGGPTDGGGGGDGGDGTGGDAGAQLSLFG